MKLYHLLFYKLFKAGEYFDKVNKSKYMFAFALPMFVFVLFESIFLGNVIGEIEFYLNYNLPSKIISIPVFIIVLSLNLIHFLRKFKWKEIIEYYDKKTKNESINKKLAFILLSLFGGILIIVFFIIWTIDIRDRNTAKKYNIKGEVTDSSVREAKFKIDAINKYKRNEKTKFIVSRNFVFLENEFNWFGAKATYNLLKDTNRSLPQYIIDEAKKHPDAIVYEVDYSFVKNNTITKKAIIIFWTIDDKGNIEKEFFPNPEYSSK